MSGFTRYLIWRFVQMAATLLAVSLMVYAIIELMPGDFAERELFRKFNGTGVTVTQADIDNVRAQLGLDRPFLVRYADWIWGIVTRFDFGPAFRVETTVNRIIALKVGSTMAVIVSALLLSYLVAIPVGMYVATRRRGMADAGLSIVSYMGLAIPGFALALLLLYVNVTVFGADVTGLISEQYKNAPWSLAKVQDFLIHAMVPIIVLGWSATAFQLQTMRALMGDELGKLYVTAARARGLDGFRLYWRYPARQALLPMINSLGFDLNRIFNELPVVALILVLGELGQELLNAYLDADQNTAAGILLVITSLIVILNFFTDLLIAAIDPRIRLGG